MTIQLPQAIADFFRVSNDGEADTLVHCFEEDALVRDEKHTHRGSKAIQAWLQEARRKYAYRVEPLSVEPLSIERQDAGITVRALVSGNFPGSPVQLDHLFQLNGSKIASLEIR